MALPNFVLTDLTPSPPAASQRRPLRPPVGLPGGRTRWRLGSVVSTLIHVGLLWLLLREPNYGGLVAPLEQGAGGPGPAGGGGGRSRMEIIQYVQVQPPPPPPPTPKPTFVFVPPEIKPLPPPIQPLRLEPLVAPGNNTGAAVDPTAGTGPGTGGGVGSGVGTGRGSSIGPGTGGGEQENYPPETEQFFLPPMPVPAALKGRVLIAEFDVDERGKVVGLKFTETGDRSYDRRLAEVFKGYRFRPGHRKDGTPVRMKAQVKFEL